MRSIITRFTPYSGLLAALAIGLMLRLANIGAEPYWGDEILSLDIATYSHSFAEMVRYVANVEFHPPLYYLLLRPWAMLFGTGEAAVRALSVIGGLGTVAATWVCGKTIFRSLRAANVAALLVAVSPVGVEFGQEARPYALLACAATIGVTALWKGLREPHVSALATYVVAMLVAVYLHYSAFFIVLATATWWLIEIAREREGARASAFVRWLVAHGAMFLGFSPWLVPLFFKLSLSGYDFYGAARYGASYRGSGFIGETFDLIVWTTPHGAYHLIEHVAQAIAKGVLAVAAFFAARTLGSEELRRDGVGSAAAYAAWLAVVPTIAFVASPLSVAYAPLWIRHVAFVAVPIALIVGFIASRLRFRAALATVAVFAVSLVPTLAGVAGNDAEWDHYHRIGEVGEHIAAHARPDDLVIVAFAAVRSDLAHYLPDDLPVTSLLPLADYGNDLFRDRHRLGFLENEGQVRGGRLGARRSGAMELGVPVGADAAAAVQDKLRRLVETHDARRVWLYSFSAKDDMVHGWFSARGWRHAFIGIEGIFALDLYEAPASGEVGANQANDIR